MQSVLSLLQHRRSVKAFGTNAPNEEQLAQMFKAAMRVPDHGRLKPYRFFVVQNEGLAKLKQALVATVSELQLGERDAQKAESLTSLAPMIVGVVAHLDEENAKVPAWEQQLTAGCATYALQLAAHAQGFDSKWITKSWVNGSKVRELFQCRVQDKVIALLLIGSPAEGETAARAKESEAFSQFVQII